MQKLAGIVLLAVMILVGCGGDGASQAPAAPPPAVTVVAASPQAVSSGVSFLGRTEAVARVDLQARVQGYLEQRNFQDGAIVEAGKLLFVIEQAPYEAAVASAQAQVTGAQAALAKAQQDVARLSPLRERGAVSQAEFDAAEATRLEAEASVQQAEADLRVAQLNLNYTQIRAPMAGDLGAIQIDVGNLVGPEVGSLATLIQLDPIYVNFDIAERDVLTYKQRVLDGVPSEAFQVQLRLANDAIYPLPGDIDFVDDQVNPATGTVTLRAVFPNPDKLLVPGQFVTVLFQRTEAEEKLVVPQASIQEDQAGRFVLVVDESSTVQVRRVVTGTRTGTGWVVEEGLNPGEQVIFQGLQRVRPGVTVEATPAQLPNAVEG